MICQIIANSIENYLLFEKQVNSLQEEKCTQKEIKDYSELSSGRFLNQIWLQMYYFLSLILINFYKKTHN